jgi:sporulation protein YlmC with PRC-barrel domain
MTGYRSLTAAAALTLALAAPAFAQSTTNSTDHATTPPAMTQTSPAPAAASSSAMLGSSHSDVYRTSNNDVRASKVIGASVYNDHDQKIGTVDELLMSPKHDVTQVVLSVGGFLGVDSKLVAVNIDQLQVKPDRIVMSGATKDGLTRMPTYKFTKSS